MVGDDAQVYGDARVSGKAQIYGAAQVYENAQVGGEAKVCASAQLRGNARADGEARVVGTAQLGGDAWITKGILTQGLILGRLKEKKPVDSMVVPNSPGRHVPPGEKHHSEGQGLRESLLQAGERRTQQRREDAAKPRGLVNRDNEGIGR